MIQWKNLEPLLFTSNEQEKHFNQLEEPSEIHTACHQTDNTGCRFLSVSQSPYLNMNRNKKPWQKCVTWSPFFRMTWAVPDFLITVAATNQFTKMDVQSGQGCATSGHTIKPCAGELDPAVERTDCPGVWLHIFSPSVTGRVCASVSPQKAGKPAAR